MIRDRGGAPIAARARGDRAELLPRPGTGDDARSSPRRSSARLAAELRAAAPARDRRLDRVRHPLGRRRVGVGARPRRPRGAPSSPAATRASAAAIAAGSSARTTSPPSSPAIRPASVPAASARIGRPAARYSKSLMLSSCERVGWASSSRASASRCSASARSRGEAAGEDDPRRGDVGREQRALVVGQRPGDHELEPRGGVRVGARRARASASTSGARVAPVAAEAAGVDERDALGVEQAGRLRPGLGAAELGVPAVRDQQRVGDPAARAGRRPPARRRRRPRRRRRASGARAARRGGAGARSETAAAAARTSTRRGRRRPRARRAARSAQPDRVRRLGRRGGDHAVEARARAAAAARASARTAAQAATSGSGTSTLLSGCGRPL